MDKKVVNKTLTDLVDAVKKCKRANGITREMIYATIDSAFPESVERDRKERGKRYCEKCSHEIMYNAFVEEQ
jgi:hypothetical protein